MTGEVWPPPATESTVWRRVDTVEGLKSVRPARLWGEQVEVDSRGFVFCPGCRAMLEPAQLLAPDSPHVPTPKAVRQRRGGLYDPYTAGEVEP